MSAKQLIQDLKRLDIHIEVGDGGYLEIDAPANVLTDDIKVSIATHKEDLIHQLAIIETDFGIGRRSDVMALLTDPQDLQECQASPELLRAFAGSLLDHGEIEPVTQPDDTSQGTNAAENASESLVCCADCQHFQPDTVGDGTGIGDCTINAPSTRLDELARPNERSLYPNAERHCHQFTEVTQP